jgi:hypothetical protein
MATVSTAPTEEARSIFADLGYDVIEDDAEYRAIRGWKEVLVTPVTDPTEAPTDGALRCFVTWQEDAGALVRQLGRADPNCEYAVIGVAEDGSYAVERAPDAGC